MQLEHIVPEIEGPLLKIAEAQEEFHPITAVAVHQPGYGFNPKAIQDKHGRPCNAIVLAFRMSEAQVERILDGERDIYLSLLTFMEPMPGIIVALGKDDASAIWNAPIVERDQVNDRAKRLAPHLATAANDGETEREAEHERESEAPSEDSEPDGTAP